MKNILEKFSCSGSVPAQWQRHAATVMAYPFDEEVWFGRLPQVRAEYHELVRVIASKEDVYLLAQKSEFEELHDTLPELLAAPAELGRVRLLPIDCDDVWLRDSGPIVACLSNNERLALDFEFNAWGRKFPWEKDNGVAAKVAESLTLPSKQVPLVFEGGSIDFNGAGAALTTRQCLLEPQRNPQFRESELDAILKKVFELKELIWLDDGLVGDHTDGHVDTIARFVNEDTVLCHVAEEAAHPSFERLERNLKTLQKLAQTGRSAVRHVEAIPVPKKTSLFDQKVAPFSYLNFYFCNAALLVPQFGDENDSRVLQMLQKWCTDRPVVGLPATHIMTGGGVFNCLTQQVPVGEGESCGH